MSAGNEDLRWKIDEAKRLLTAAEADGKARTWSASQEKRALCVS
jgi:hypothetical protein